MTTSAQDRRRVARYGVRVPICILDVGTGSTLDISASGIAFLIDRLLEQGAEIRFELRLEDGFLLQCNGRVVRVEERGANTFAAATIDDMAVGSRLEH